MKVLVLNCGSSTLKFQLIEVSTASGSNTSGGDKKLARGIVDQIGGPSSLRFEIDRAPVKKELVKVRDHQEAGGKVIKWLNPRLELSAPGPCEYSFVHEAGPLLLLA